MLSPCFPDGTDGLNTYGDYGAKQPLQLVNQNLFLLDLLSEEDLKSGCVDNNWDVLDALVQKALRNVTTVEDDVKLQFLLLVLRKEAERDRQRKEVDISAESISSEETDSTVDSTDYTSSDSETVYDHLGGKTVYHRWNDEADLGSTTYSSVSYESTTGGSDDEKQIGRAHV